MAAIAPAIAPLVDVLAALQVQLQGIEDRLLAAQQVRDTAIAFGEVNGANYTTVANSIDTIGNELWDFNVAHNRSHLNVLPGPALPPAPENAVVAIAAPQAIIHTSLLYHLVIRRRQNLGTSSVLFRAPY